MPDTEGPDRKSGSRFPSAFTILFALIVLVAALTWIIPAGQYERVASEALGKDVPVADSYAPSEADPQEFFDVILAPIAGFYDPVEYVARAMMHLDGCEICMIPFLMTLFAIGGTTCGMAEETLAFYVLLIPVMIAAKYDALTAVAVILLGAGVGVLGSTINAFSAVFASDAVGVRALAAVHLATSAGPDDHHHGRRSAGRHIWSIFIALTYGVYSEAERDCTWVSSQRRSTICALQGVGLA